MPEIPFYSLITSLPATKVLPFVVGSVAFTLAGKVYTKVLFKYVSNDLKDIYRRVDIFLAARRDRNLTFVNCLRQQHPSLNDNQTNPVHLQDLLLPKGNVDPKGDVEIYGPRDVVKVACFVRKQADSLFGVENVAMMPIPAAATTNICVRLSPMPIHQRSICWGQVCKLLFFYSYMGPQLLNISGKERILVGLRSQAEAGGEPDCDRRIPFLKGRERRVEDLYEWVLYRPNAVRSRIDRAAKEGGCLASLGLSCDKQVLLIAAARRHLKMEHLLTQLGFPGLVSFRALITRHDLFLPATHFDELDQVEVPEALQQLNDPTVATRYQKLVVRIQEAVSCV